MSLKSIKHPKQNSSKNHDNLHSSNVTSTPKKVSPQTIKLTKAYLIRRILITNVLTLGVIVLTYFWMIFMLSNVNSFWDIFRSKDVYVETDSIAPVRPYISPIKEAINGDSIDIQGKAEAGVKVILYSDDAKFGETISDSDGNFTFTSVSVGLSPVKIYAKAEDESGNQSPESINYFVNKDIEPPTIEILTPQNGESYKSTGHSYKVTGKTEPKAIVNINDQLSVVNPNGDFFASIRLEEGNNEIKIKAKDIAGNEKEEKVNINFDKID